MTPAPALVATVALIHAAAATLNLDLLLVQAIVRVESNYDPNCISDNDYGLLQVNRATLAAMSGGWAKVPPRELLKPEVGLQAGTLCLREYLVCALQDELYLTVDHRAAGAVVAALEPEARRRVIERALAYYNGGQGVKRELGGGWANQEYVNAVLREWVRLRIEADGSSQ
jgi:soluble lytic murein transglycosylase-like protein